MNTTLLNLPNIYRQVIFITCLVAFIVFKVDPPIALLAGLVIALVIGHPFIHLNKKATTLLLQVSVVCLGFKMDFEHALKAGKEGFLFTVCTIAVTLVAGYFIGKKLKIDKNTSLLISNGTAICGGSAIAAISPIIKATNEQISVSLGTVFILNSIALIIFPPIGHYLAMSAEQFGTWCAIAIHDTSSVVGAASAYTDSLGHEALPIATTIKLERALWIIPLALGTAYFQKERGKIKIPYFIFYFIIAILIATYLPRYVPALNNKIGGATLFEYLYLIGRKGLVITLFLIGSGLSLKTLKTVGWRPILQGVLLWILIGSVSLAVIRGVV
ncbi:MAG: putative sulfate exporter family transporter [Bacteroidota bacterium]